MDEGAWTRGTWSGESILVAEGGKVSAIARGEQRSCDRTTCGVERGIGTVTEEYTFGRAGESGSGGR